RGGEACRGAEESPITPPPPAAEDAGAPAGGHAVPAVSNTQRRGMLARVNMWLRSRRKPAAGDGIVVAVPHLPEGAAAQPGESGGRRHDLQERRGGGGQGVLPPCGPPHRRAR